MLGLRPLHALLRARAVYVLLAAMLFLSVTNPALAADRKVVSRVKPEYPLIAKRMKVTGTVMLSVVVLPSGEVKAANFMMGEHLLLVAAQTAIEKWKFEPCDEQTVEDVEIEFPRDASPDSK